MEGTTLVFRPDPVTGLAELAMSGVQLPDQDARDLQEEIKRRYPRFVSERSGETTFNTRLRGFPAGAKFRFSVRNPSDRSPDLIFEPVMKPLAQSNDFRQAETAWAGPIVGDVDSTATNRRDGQSGTGAGWSKGFFDELRRLFSAQATANLDEADRHELQFVIQELQAFAARRPNDLTPLLLAGYVSFAERMANEHDPQRAGIYALAARGIDTLFEALLPKLTSQVGTGHRAAEPSAQVGQAVRIKHMTRFLARCLGVPDDWRV